MRVWPSPCYLHYSVFCVVTYDQVLAWFRSSLHSDLLRRSCLLSLATRKKKPLLPRVGSPHVRESGFRNPRNFCV